MVPSSAVELYEPAVSRGGEAEFERACFPPPPQPATTRARTATKHARADTVASPAHSSSRGLEYEHGRVGVRGRSQRPGRARDVGEATRARSRRGGRGDRSDRRGAGARGGARAPAGG